MSLFARNLFQIRELLREQGTIFCYSGYITEAILSGLGQAIKQKLALEDADSNTIRGVFAVFVEQMQNIIRYSAERESRADPDGDGVLSYGTVTVGRDEDGVFVTCGNTVACNDVPRLQKSLVMIQKLDRGGLKALHKQILKGEIPEGSKGAGVGFVDIAQRASRPIEFDFMTLDDQYALFTLKAII